MSDGFSRLSWKWALVVALASPWWMSCGAECGEGTVEDGGACVVAPVACGEGTALEGTTCVISDAGCAEGTTLEAGICVALERCGPDATPNTDGVCVPNTLVSCGEGTIDSGGLCLPDLDVLCSDGTVSFEGRCLTPVEVLRAADPEVESEPNDPFSSGIPNAITLPSEEGASILLSGEISAPAADGTEDWDAFSFTTTEDLEVLEVEIIAAGLPNPFYFVFGDLLVDGDGEYFRQSPSNAGVTISREIVFPSAGEYLLYVSDQDNAGGTGGVGGEGLEYFVRITRLPNIDLQDAPQTDIESARYSVPAEQLSTASDKLLNLVPDGTGDTLVSFERTAFDGAYAFQHLLIFSAEGALLAEEAFTECFTDSFSGTQCYLRDTFRYRVPEAGVYTILDYSSSSGTPITGTEIAISTPEKLPPERRDTFDNGGEEDFIVTVPAGFLLSLSLEGGEDVSPYIEIIDVATDARLERVTGTSGTTESLRWYFEEETRVLVLVGDNLSETDPGDDYSYTLLADTIPVQRMDAIDPAQSAISVTATSEALNAAGKDSTWLALPVTPDALGELTVQVEESEGQIGFSIFQQSLTSFDELSVAFPEAGVASSTELIAEETLLLIELVVIEGLTSGASVTADWATVPTYTGDGNACADGPIVVTEPGLFVIELASYTNDFAADTQVYGECGDSTTERDGKAGPDATFLITVPAGQVLTLDADGTGEGNDSTLTLLQNQADLCTSIGEDPTGLTCLEYDDDSGDGLLAFLEWENTGTEPVEVFVILDNYSVADTLTSEDTNILNVSFRAP